MKQKYEKAKIEVILLDRINTTSIFNSGAGYGQDDYDGNNLDEY